MAGGTGTSDNAAFICFAPYEKPEVAVSTYFEQGGYGRATAAPWRQKF